MSEAMTHEVDSQMAEVGTLLERALILHDLGRKEELISLLMPALDDVEGHVMAYSLCVGALIDLQRRREAVALSARGLARHPGSAALLRLHGCALSWLRKDKESLAAIDRSLELEPDSAAGHGSRAFALERLGRTREAMESARISLELNPADLEHRLTLARLEQRTKNKEAACALVDGVLAEDPTHAEALAFKAQLAADADRAGHFLRQALWLSPGNLQYQQLYRLYTSNLERDAFLCACLPLAVILAYSARSHPAMAWFLEHYLLVALFAGFFLLKRTGHHFFNYFAALLSSLILLSLLQDSFTSGLGSGLAARIVAGILKIPFLVLVSLCGALLVGKVNAAVQDGFELLLIRTETRRAYAAKRQFLRAVGHSALMAVLPLLVFWSILHAPVPYLLYLLLTLPLLVYSAGCPEWRDCVRVSWCYSYWSAAAMALAGLMNHRWPDLEAASLAVLFVCSLLTALRLVTGKRAVV